MEKSEYNQVVAAKWDYLREVATNICGENDAEDAVIEAVSYVWTYIDSGRQTDDDIGGSLINATRQRAINLKRDAYARNQVEILESDLGMSLEEAAHEWAFQTPSVEDQVIAEEEQRTDVEQLPIMEWARKHVPQVDLAIFLALRVDDFPAHKVAAEYGYSRAQVYNIAERVAQQLQAAAKREGLV